MKKVNFSLLGIVLLALTIINGCQKETPEQQDQSAESDLKRGSHHNGRHGCRLVADSGLSDGFLLTYHYNIKGFVDSYHQSKTNLYDISCKFEYNSRNLVSKVKFTYDGDVYDIVLTYNKNKLVGETWYYENTMDTADYYVNTYNKKGQLVKKDDPPYKYYCIFKYNSFGDLTSTEIINYDDGSLYYATEYSYSGHIRNPFRTVTGLPVSLLWVEDYIGSPNRFTGLKQYYNDENGDQVVVFNWESDETVIKAGPENYAVYQYSKDVVSGTETDQIWRYENCTDRCDQTYAKSAVAGRQSNSISPNSIRFETEFFKQKMEKMKKMNQRYLNKK